MKKLWEDDAWKEYLEWQTKDKSTLKKINRLMIIARLKTSHFEHR